MREFKPIDPEHVLDDPRLVTSTIHPEDPKKTYHLLIEDDYAILATSKYWEDKSDDEDKWPSEWLHYQLEFPKQGLPWFVDTIEQKFFASDKDGGLPLGVFHVTEPFGEERLKVQRCFGLTGLESDRQSGFDLTTVDRREHRISKAFSFTDAALFEMGLFDWFKAQADRIRRGEI